MSAGLVLPFVAAACWDRRDVETDGRKGLADGVGVLARDTDEARDIGGRDIPLGAADPARDADGVGLRLSDIGGATSQPKRAARMAVWEGSLRTCGNGDDGSPTIDASESLSSAALGSVTDDTIETRLCTCRLL